MERALIIDDDKLLLFAISKALQGSYEPVIAVSNKTDAIRELSSSFYHICFLDLADHDPSWLDVLKTIRTVSPGTKVVAMIGLPGDGEMKRQIEDHAFFCLEKPFAVSELKEVARLAFGTDEKKREATPSTAGLNESLRGRPSPIPSS
jgi:DNA-binding NtrC family response regulator